MICQVRIPKTRHYLQNSHLIKFKINICTYLITVIWSVQRNKALAEHLLTQETCMGQIRKPLLNLDAIDCPPDILHMRKAIYSKLLDQVVLFAISQKHQYKLIQEMERIGINFRYSVLNGKIARPPKIWYFINVFVLYFLGF